MNTDVFLSQLTQAITDIQGYIVQFHKAQDVNALAYLLEALQGITVVVRSYYK